MLEQELTELNELKSKKKLTGGEKARVKILEKKQQKETESTKKANAFSTKPTTKVAPVPIRFTSDELAGLTQKINQLKDDNPRLIVEVLGDHARAVNRTTLIRAAIKLLESHSDEEIIQAIKDVKLSMLR